MGVRARQCTASFPASSFETRCFATLLRMRPDWMRRTRYSAFTFVISTNSDASLSFRRGGLAGSATA